MHVARFHLVSGVCLLIPSFFWPIAATRAAEIRITPVGADAPHAIRGGAMYVSEPLGWLHFEVFVRGWDPDQDGDPLISSYHITIDDAGLSAGVSGRLAPIRVPCVSNLECGEAIGYGSSCFNGTTEFACYPGLVDTGREDWIFTCCYSIYGIHLEPVFLEGVALFSRGVLDNGGWRYVGTLIFEPTADAFGRFIVAPNTGPGNPGPHNPGPTYLQTTDDQFLSLHPVSSGSVTIGNMAACCRPNGTCTDGLLTDCVQAGGVPVLGTQCLSDYGNGTDEACADCNGNDVWDVSDINLEHLLDCNQNRIPDECDIAERNSRDCDRNAVPDECEPDCNDNGQVDACDIESDRTLDCDRNGELDSCDDFPGFEVTLVRPATGDTLYQTRNNQIDFSLENLGIVYVDFRMITVQQLLPDGAFGPNLSNLLFFEAYNSTHEGDPVLMIEDHLGTLMHGRWYAIRNNGSWPCFAPFEYHLLLQMGDANNDGMVNFSDLSLISTQIPTASTYVLSNPSRLDINGSRYVDHADLSAAYAHIPSFRVPKPSGH